MPEQHQTFETTQPWVVYTYGATHDRWWPPWNSTRVLGRARIGLTCAVCGVHEVAKVRMPRFGTIVDKGHHPARTAFLTAHAHQDRGDPASWAMPYLNPAAHEGGINLDLLAMRLEADLNQRDDET